MLASPTTGDKLLLGAQVLVENDLTDVTLVGHSLAGVWLQLLTQLMPERVGRLLFLDATILLPGESFFNNRVAGSQSDITLAPVFVPAQVSRA